MSERSRFCIYKFKKIMRKIALKAAATITALIPSIALAAPIEPTTPITTAQDVINNINKIASWFFTAFLALAVIFLIWSAFLYLTAAGNSEKVKSAKNALIYAIIAIIVALIAGGIPSIIGNVFNVTI
jgi:hypothetical protein